MEREEILRFVVGDLMEDDNDYEEILAVVNANLINIAYDENAEEDRAVPVRNANYFEETVPQYSLDEFRSRFRMSRATVEELVRAIGQQLQRRHVVPLRKKVLVALWILSKKETFLDVGDRFNISSGTAHFIFKEIMVILARMRDQYIQWPFGREQDIVVAEFQRKSHGFPGVVGAIDGCHIQIKAPVHNSHDYYNRKQVHSVILQAVCDHKLKFTNIFVGMPGRAHDARVFRLSPLYNELIDDVPLLPRERHIIGDAAYPLLPCIITPFRNNGHLTQQQLTFNRKLSGIRSTIERAFGILKGKLRRLKYLDMGNIHDIPNVITAACVLHNFMLLHNEEEEWWREEENEDSDSEGEGEGDGDDNGDADEHDARMINDARIKRNYIMSLF